MGFDAEIDNSERNSVVENLKSEVQCSICCSIFEDPVKLDCCDGHLCKKCYENVKKQFQNCPLCREANFTAKFSRLMVTVLSQYKLFCPAAECNESVPYANFTKHKESCPALNKKPCPHCKKLYWKNDFIDHFACFEELNKTAQGHKKKVIELESKLGPITQSRDAHAQNNKTLKAVNIAYANKISQLEDDLEADKEKIQNQRKSLSSLNKKVHEYNDIKQKLEHLTIEKAELGRALAVSGQQLKISYDKVKSSEMTISRLRSTINRTNNESNYISEEDFNLANQELLRLRHRNRELEQKLECQPKKSSGFFGLFKK